MNITAVLRNAQATGYVPPVSPRLLGIRLFEAGQPVDKCIGDEMRRGWLWALRASAWADGSAHMVRNGEQVSL